MKLNELAVTSPTKQTAKVFESYFGNSVKFDQMTQGQARAMLKRVRSLIAEHRRTPEFHRSEQNPSYLKLVVMEQTLATVATTPGVAPQQTAQANPANIAMTMQNRKKQATDQSRQLDLQIQALQKQKADLMKQANNPMAETRLSRRLREASEIQQAQVVLASQDMVDQVQKMIEQVTSMQFKDLPALVDQIKNEIGVDQSAQFNTDANAALGGLVQNLQGSKQQLEQALGVVTGQAPTIPGQDMTPVVPPSTEELPSAELPAEMPPEEEETSVEPTGTLGRNRR